MSIRTRITAASPSPRPASIARAASAAGALLLLAACSGAGRDGAGAGGDAESSASALAPDTYAWGFAWVDPPYGISSSYSFNSTGGSNTYSGSAGDYVVTMNGLGVSGGTVQVVAYGSTATRCKVANWGPSGTAMSVHVRCHDPSGALAESPFVVFFNKGASGQLGAHAWYSGSSVPATWSWNSAGGVNAVTQTSVGHYTVSLPGIAFSNASVHVTAYGWGPEYCKIVSWGTRRFTSGIDVNVRCNDTSGNPTNSAFAINYTSSTPRSGMIGGHAWIDSATTASSFYQSEQDLVECFSASPITVSGFADVNFPDIYDAQIPTTTLSTAYGDDGSYCKVRNWLPAGSGYTAHTSCFTAAGAEATTRFTSSFMSGSYPGPC